MHFYHRKGNLTAPSSLQVVPDAYGFYITDLTIKANSDDSPNLPNGVDF